MTTITEPGLYPDLSFADYLAQHDWLSSSGIKTLIHKTPAHFIAAQKAGETYTDAFDFGKAFHTELLGEGDDQKIVLVDAASWQGKAAQAERAAIREAGNVPLLAKDYPTIKAMVASVREHSSASRLFANGRREVSAFWVDPATGCPCRARFDFLSDPVTGRRLIVPDLKSANDASPRGFSKALFDYGYAFAWVHYRDALIALGLDQDPAFLFVATEKADPYLTNVLNFGDPDHAEDQKRARVAVDRARRLWLDCRERDDWPGFGPSVNPIGLPTWAAYLLDDMETA